MGVLWVLQHFTPAKCTSHCEFIINHIEEGKWELLQSGSMEVATGQPPLAPQTLSDLTLLIVGRALCFLPDLHVMLIFLNTSACYVVVQFKEKSVLWPASKCSLLCDAFMWHSGSQTFEGDKCGAFMWYKSTEPCYFDKCDTGVWHWGSMSWV